MVTQQLIDFIRQQAEQGASKEIIFNNLIAQGWQQQDIEAAFVSLNGSINQASSLGVSEKPEIKGNFVRKINTLFAISFIPGIARIAVAFGVFSISKELDGWISLVSIVLLIVWMKFLNDLWRVMGKKHGWLVGLVLFIPAGVFFAYAIAIQVASKYKNGEAFPKYLEIGFTKK